MESVPHLQAETLPLPALNARRRQAVALRLEGHTLQQAAQASGLSVPTVVAAHKAWKQGGWDAVDVRPRGRKPEGQRALSQQDEQALVAQWRQAESGVWTLNRACALARTLYPALESLAASQLEPMIARLLDRAGLTPQDTWDSWRLVAQGPLAEWQRVELPGLRQLAREADAALLALAERTLQDPPSCQLAAHAARGTAFWRITPAWPTEADWIAFWQGLREEVGRPVWLLTDNPWLGRRPTLAAWLAEHGGAVRLIHPPAQRSSVPDPQVFDPL
jgi:sulfate adenylyltransferase subunit 2